MLAESPYWMRLCATTLWSRSMTRSKLFCLAAILSAVATPVLAAGETATKLWSAPVGHRQPRATDIPPSVSPQTSPSGRYKRRPNDKKRLPGLLTLSQPFAGLSRAARYWLQQREQ